MKFSCKYLNDQISFLYGFKNNNRIYDMVMTLEQNRDVCVIHAWLSRVPMNFKDLYEMWEALKVNFKSTYFEFEVFEEHKRFYKKVFKSFDERKSKTFDGFNSYILKVHRECELLKI